MSLCSLILSLGSSCDIQAAVKGSAQTAQAGLSLSDRTYHIVGNLMSQLGAQWLDGRVLETEGPRVRASPDSLRCVLEQDTLIQSDLLGKSLSDSQITKP